MTRLPHSQPDNTEAEALAFAVLTTPRPIEEYHEDMGSVLWWCWEPPRPFRKISERVVDSGHNGQWLGEPPYVGSPNDLGQTVEVTLRGHNLDKLMRGMVGGWPGYHTHFTLIPKPQTPSMPLEDR